MIIEYGDGKIWTQQGVVEGYKCITIQRTNLEHHRHDERLEHPLPELPEHIAVWRDRHALAFADLWKNRWLDSKEWQLNRVRMDAPKPSPLFKIPA